MKQIFTIAGIVWLEMLRRKDLYALLILMGGFLGAMLSLNVFGLGGIIGHVKEMGLLMLWACTWYLAINFSARQLPREEATGTIFTLLAKPVTRAQLIAGKWLGAWGAALAAAAAFYLLLIVVVASRGGGFEAAVLAQHVMLHACLLAALAALGILLSTCMNYDAAASLGHVLSLGAWFLLPRVPELAMHADGARFNMLLILYFALPHLEVFDMRLRLAHGWEPADWRVVGMVAAYGLAVTAWMLLLAWLVYRRRRFSRAARI